MNTRSVAVHATLALAGLVLAYLVWTDASPEVTDEAVTLFECDPESLDRLEWRSEERDVVVELSRTDGALASWITVTRRASEGAEETSRFVGSREVETYLESLAPLRALRSLGAISDAELAEVGLADPEARVTLRCGERTQTFRVGGRSYGSGARYVRPEDGDVVSLVERDVLAPLESAEHRLMQRSLHTFTDPELTELTVRAWGRELRLLHRNRLDPSHGEWVDASRPDRRNEVYGNWLASYARLRISSYLEPDARPGADLEASVPSGAPVLSLTFVGEDGELGHASLERVDAQPPAYYARTETTRSWVRVPTSVAASLEEDLRGVLELPPLERAPSAPAPGDTSDAGPTPDAGPPDP